MSTEPNEDGGRAATIAPDPSRGDTRPTDDVDAAITRSYRLLRVLKVLLAIVATLITIWQALGWL